MKGKLLVFEGTDGSGKTVQIELLEKFLTSQGVSWEAISFPQYGQNEYAQKIKDYLAGKMGSIRAVNPRYLAELYANDRLTARAQIKNWLEAGKLVIANRYVSSSKAHLGANMDMSMREEFFRWLEDLEYKENSMPKEDLTILLNVDPRIGQANSQIKNGSDLHEDNLAHQSDANAIYMHLANANPNWYVVDCMKDGEMKSPEEIHEEVSQVILSERSESKDK